MTKTKKNKLMILTGVLLVICIIIAGINLYQGKSEDIKESASQILTIDSDNVTKLSWTNEGINYNFKKDGNWIYEEDDNFPVNETKINQLLSIFNGLQSTFKIENVEDYDQYGLENPVCTIIVSTKDNTYTIQLGDFSKIDEQRYVSIGDGNVYLVSEDPMDLYNVVLADLIKNDDVSTISSDVTNIDFKGNETYKIVYDEDNDNSYDDLDVYFTNDKPLDTSKVNLYLNSISSLNLTNYVSYNATEKEIEAYGLNKPDQTIEIRYVDTDEEKQSLSVSVSKVEDIAYARVGESKILYEITSDEYDALMACSYNDLRHTEVVIPSFGDVKKIDFELDGEKYTLTQEKETWIFNKEEIDFTDIQAAMEDLNAIEFVSEKTSDKEEISFTLYLENEKEYTVTIYRKDGNYCVCEINGEITCEVERNAVVTLIEALNTIVLN